MKKLFALSAAIIIMLLIINPGHLFSQNVYFGNLHSHTSYSDGSGIPEDAYAHARDVAKVDFLAITEHNHKQAGKIADDPQLYNGTVSLSLISTANRFNDDGHFVAIYGQEFSSISSGNHANVFEVGEVISSSIVPNGQWDKLFNTWLPGHPDSQGKPAIMLLNHPAINCPNSKEYGIDDFDNRAAWLAALSPHVRLMNIVNGPSHEATFKAGAPSESEFLRYLNLGLHVAPTADQDNHLPNWGDAADTRTGIIAASLTKANILDAMRERHVYASEDRNLRIIGKVNGQHFGKIFSGNEVPQAGGDLQITLSINDDDEPDAFYTIDVYRDTPGDNAVADVIKQIHHTGNGMVTLDGIKYTGGNQYFFIKLTQTDDDAVKEDRVWLAPFWFEPGGASPSPGTVTAVALSVNEVTEEAVITNIGDVTVNLKNWVLRSVNGDQKFKFTIDLQLAPGASTTVTSGPNAKQQLPKFVKWTNSNMWSNSGDPGQLIDPNGNVRAETE